MEKDERWWLVTPEGNAFLSFGINYLHPDLWRQDYNREAWKKRLGLDDLNSREFAPALKAWFLQRCRQYGFNTIGVHTELSIVNSPQPSMPYMQPIHFVDIPHWKPEISDSNFKDVFSDDFTAHCDRMAKELAAPARDDPFLLSYAMTDCPLLTEDDVIADEALFRIIGIGEQERDKIKRYRERIAKRPDWLEDWRIVCVNADLKPGNLAFRS